MFIRIDTDYPDEKAVNTLLKYIKYKAVFIGGQNLQNYNAAQQMRIIRDYYYQNNGILIYHFLLCYDINCEFLSLFDMYEIAYLICEAFEGLQVFFGVHIGHDGWHTHFAVNPVYITNGKKICLTHANVCDITGRIKKILKQYHINKLTYIDKYVPRDYRLDKAYEDMLIQAGIIPYYFK